MVKYYKDDLSCFFYALADESRRHILELVSVSPRRASDLARRFDMSFPAVSKHIKVLERAGFVTRNIVGREHHIGIDKENFGKAREWIDKY